MREEPKQRGFPDYRDQLGIMIGLGCRDCGGYITVEQVEGSAYQAVCGSCGHEYRVTFPREALENAAPQLLAASLGLIGALMRAPEAGAVIAEGSPGHQSIRQALTAIAQATGYPPDFWERMGARIGDAMRASDEAVERHG